MKIEKMSVGMTLYATERRQMGHTTMRETVVIHYYVKAMTPDGIVVDRNGRSITMSRRRAEKLRGTHPKCTSCGRIGTHERECSKSRKRRTPAESSSS